MTTTRIVLCTKDIIFITGKSERTVRRMVAAMRKKYRKAKGKPVSVEDFCNFTGLREEQVREILKEI